MDKKQVYIFIRNVGHFGRHPITKAIVKPGINYDSKGLLDSILIEVDIDLYIVDECLDKVLPIVQDWLDTTQNYEVEFNNLRRIVQQLAKTVCPKFQKRPRNPTMATAIQPRKTH